MVTLPTVQHSACKLFARYFGKYWFLQPSYLAQGFSEGVRSSDILAHNISIMFGSGIAGGVFIEVLDSGSAKGAPIRAGEASPLRGGTFKRGNTPLPSSFPLALSDEFASANEAMWSVFLKRSSQPQAFTYRTAIRRLREFLGPIFKALESLATMGWPKSGPWKERKG